ncbi:hypothetical protein [Acidovorax sp.]|uniref:hypothetical protein n=1 Tax=Acidovorax sp. TaxID=1872122 RepID=UPI0025C6885F|nr:hypothetical protein [Acidovorax sp.]
MSRAQVIRRGVVWGGLALTVAASLWTARQRSLDEQNASVVLPVDTDMQTGASIAPVDAEEASIRASPRAGVRISANDVRGDVDPFAVRSWLPAPPPPEPTPPPPPPPQPTAPALPFVYIGRQEQSDGTTPTVFYLTRGTDLFAVVAGDSLGDDYRFDGLEQGSLRFSYLPLSAKQELNPGLNP